MGIRYKALIHFFHTGPRAFWRKEAFAIEVFAIKELQFT
jgi:hypothetical protein